MSAPDTSPALPCGPVPNPVDAVMLVRALIPLLLALTQLACSDAPPAASDTSTFLLVRHAEKAADDPRDPSLTPAGRQRAERLARLVAEAPLAAVYTTDFRRTRATAEPAADAHGLDLALYDAEQAAAELAASLRQRHTGEAVLVVGHSNTVPGITAALCGCEVAPIGDDDYGNLYRVRIEPGATPVLEHERY